MYASVRDWEKGMAVKAHTNHEGHEEQHPTPEVYNSHQPTTPSTHTRREREEGRTGWLFPDWDFVLPGTLYVKSMHNWSSCLQCQAKDTKTTCCIALPLGGGQHVIVYRGGYGGVLCVCSRVCALLLHPFVVKRYHKKGDREAHE